MKYVADDGAGRWAKFRTLPPEDIRASRYVALNADLTSAGELVDAQGLAFPSQARIVAARPAAIDGERRPFPNRKFLPLDRMRTRRAIALPRISPPRLEPAAPDTLSKCAR
jgi:hypothetical protein